MIVKIQMIMPMTLLMIILRDRFAPYLRIISQFNEILGNDPWTTLRLMKYRIKGILFFNEINNRHRQKSGHKLHDKSSEEYREYWSEVEGHHLYVNALMQIKQGTEYLDRLRNVMQQTKDMLRRNLDDSLCLRKRAGVIKEIISQFEAEKYDIILNLIPVQVEGLFSDYLENSLLFDAEAGKKGMKTFEQIYKSVLMHKVWMADQKDLNLGFDTIGYFKYYFNSVYRNTVAHGNYRLLFKCGSDFDDLSEEETVEIVAHELMLDLNYIVDAVARSNELDEARNYLLYTSASLVNIKNDDEENDDFRDSDMIADLRYERLFLDLIGESRYNSGRYRHGVFISHDPVQLLYWIFNPAFEEIVGKEVVDPIREALVSKGFWDYAVSNIEKKLWRRDGKDLKRAISRLMPILKQNKEVCRLAIEVSKKINEE